MKPGRRERLGTILGRFAAVIVFLGFVLIVANSVAHKGVCCGDDGWFASIAKNLASGTGYATTLQMGGSTYGIRPFDGQIGTGPTVIIPAAVLIRVFGNRYWVPGLTVGLLWLLPLLGTAALLRREVRGPRFFLAAVVFMLFLYALFPYHFEQWYALLGEIPAGCLVLLAFTLWATSPERTGAWSGAGLLLGLAVLAKTLSLLWVFSFVLVAVGVWLGGGTKTSGWWRRLIAFGAAFGAPLLLFELWKLIALGWPGYRREGAATMSLALRQGASSGLGTTLAGRVAANLHVFTDRFAVPLLVLLAAATAALLFVLRFGSRRLCLLALALLGGFLVHFIWWSAFSLGWVRYMVAALVPLVLLLVLPIAAAPGRGWLLAPVLVIVSLSSPTWRRLRMPLDVAGRPWFAQAPSTSHSEEVTRYLEANASGRTVLTQWWAMVAPLDYESRTRIAFQPITWVEEHGTPREEFFLVSDDRWINASDPVLEATVRSCGSPTLDLAPYRVFRCNSPVSNSSAGP